jgi:hypothetical protein
MKKPNYTPGQAVEVEIHNAKTGLNTWVTGIIIDVVQGIDRPYRIEVETQFHRFMGNAAAHPDCVRPIKTPQDKAKDAVIALTDKKANKIPVAKNSQAYKTVMEAIEHPGVPCICGKGTGRGRRSSTWSWADGVRVILTRAGIRHEITNVAPQGGKAGDRVTVYLPITVVTE